ncbi:MAG: hypothetical protein AAB320_02415 [Elusimicrobiota bacterium]
MTELVAFLEQERVPYMVIGAVAGIAWGLRRATFDVDVTVWAAEREAQLVLRLAERFRARVPAPARFVAETGVLPIVVSGTNADIVFGRLSYEETAIRRAPARRLGAATVRICTPEDLIVLKVISDRPKDLQDLREVVAAVGGSLDRAYLDPIVNALAADLVRPDIRERFLSLFT